METLRLKTDRWNPAPAAVARGAELLRRGGLVAFPTETVYGLGANGLDPAAIEGIYRAKGRPSDNPLILHLSAPVQAEAFARLDDRARALMDEFWPGPLTLVLPALPTVPREVRAGLPTVALRMPAHPVALALIEAAGVPVAAPSANRSGRPSPTDAGAVLEDLAGRIDLVLDAGAADVGLESTVLDLSEKKALLLRPGGVPLEALAAFLGECPGTPDSDAARRSPGTRHRHYAPGVPVFIWHGGALPAVAASSSGFVGQNVPEGAFASTIVFSSAENYARGLFAAFRSLELDGIRSIIVEWPDEAGIGLALRDRIRRAAEG